MAAMRMRALTAVPYGGRIVPKGEEFDVMRPIEALALSYQRKAKILEGLRLHLDPVAPQLETHTTTFERGPTYISRDLGADDDSEVPSEPSPSEDPPRRKRRYRRRDLTAEP